MINEIQDELLNLMVCVSHMLQILVEGKEMRDCADNVREEVLLWRA